MVRPLELRGNAPKLPVGSGPGRGTAHFSWARR